MGYFSKYNKEKYEVFRKEKGVSYIIKPLLNKQNVKNKQNLEKQKKKSNLIVYYKNANKKVHWKMLKI